MSAQAPARIDFEAIPRNKVYREVVRWPHSPAVVERRNPMAAPCIAPQIKPRIEEKTQTLPVCEPKPIAPKHPFRDLLVEIFEGHEEFLGWTPD
jgi:hypothetical protein